VISLFLGAWVYCWGFRGCWSSYVVSLSYMHSMSVTSTSPSCLLSLLSLSYCA